MTNHGLMDSFTRLHQVTSLIFHYSTRNTSGTHYTAEWGKCVMHLLYIKVTETFFFNIILFSEIDKNIDHMTNLRKDKWVVEGKLRK